MELVNPLTSYAFDHAINVHGVLMNGVPEKQGVRFSREGWLAARDNETSSADEYGTKRRQSQRPHSRSVLERARWDYKMRDSSVFPRYHIIEPTSICNRACPFCPISALNDSRAAKKRLDWSDALAFFTECGNHDVYGLSLYQLGEPMLWSGHDEQGERLDIRALVKAAKGIGGFKAVNISTNGDVPNLHLLLDCPVDDLIISIDGHTGKTYDENRPTTTRQPDLLAFGRTIQRVKTFLHQKTVLKMDTPYVRLQIINKANTRDEIEAFIKDWITVPGVDDVYVKHLDSMRPWVGDGAVSKSEEAEKMARVFSMPCQHLWTVGSMTSEGVFNACCHDARTELTDGSKVGEKTFLEWWRSPFMATLRHEHNNGVFREPCQSCAERDCWLG